MIDRATPPTDAGPPGASPAFPARMSWGQWGLLVALSVLWGGSFLFAKVAVAEVPPFTLVLVRVGVAAAALWTVVYATGGRMPADARLWRDLLVMGALNNLVPFALFFWGQTRIGAGLASILGATTPLFAVLLAHFAWRDERITANRWLGVALGLAGVSVMIGVDLLGTLGAEVAAQLACVAAALSYALAARFARRFRAHPPLVTATGQVTASAALTLPIALIVDQPWTLAVPSPLAVGAMLALGLASTALAYLLYFRLLATAGATNALLVTLLIPVNAVLFGTMLLGEQLAATQVAGMAMIAAGLLAIDGRIIGVRMPGGWIGDGRTARSGDRTGRGDAR